MSSKYDCMHSFTGASVPRQRGSLPLLKRISRMILPVVLRSSSTKWRRWVTQGWRVDWRMKQRNDDGRLFLVFASNDKTEWLLYPYVLKLLILHFDLAVREPNISIFSKLILNRFSSDPFECTAETDRVDASMKMTQKIVFQFSFNSSTSSSTSVSLSVEWRW